MTMTCTLTDSSGRSCAAPVKDVAVVTGQVVGGFIGLNCLWNGLDHTFNRWALDKANQVCCTAFEQLPCTNLLAKFSPFASNVTSVCAGELTNLVSTVVKREIFNYSVGAVIIGGVIVGSCVYFRNHKRDGYEEVGNN